MDACSDLSSQDGTNRWAQQYLRQLTCNLLYSKAIPSEFYVLLVLRFGIVIDRLRVTVCLSPCYSATICPKLSNGWQTSFCWSFTMHVHSMSLINEFQRGETEIPGDWQIVGAPHVTGKLVDSSGMFSLLML